MTVESIRVSAPAKVNLYLGVYPDKDKAGYHRVDTVMAAVGLADEVAVSPASELRVVTVPDAGFPMQQNTAYKAAARLARVFGREPGLEIVITKRIPMCAGLGGPSTDAAAALIGACRLWGIDPMDERVVEVARSVGADVPFFLYGASAFLAGRGDELRERFEALADVPVVLVKPLEGGVSAAEAYRCFDRSPIDPEGVEPMLEAMRAADAGAVAQLVYNNLAPAACELEPRITRVLAWLRDQPGVRAAEVSGSGSCSFAICDTHDAARRIADAARATGEWWSFATKMEESGPSPLDD